MNRRIHLNILLIGTICLIAGQAHAQVTSSARSKPVSISITPATAFDSRAPDITIAEPIKRRGVRLRKKESAIFIRARVTDENGVTSVTLNDVPVPLDVEGWFEVSQPLLLGENTFVILADDAAGNRSTEVVEVERAPAIEVSGRYVALVIGINSYEGDWPSLDNAVHDARAVSELLEGQYRFDEVTSLIDQDATRERIIGEFERLADDLEPGDNLLIYYSGHGHLDERTGRGYWVPSGASGTSTASFIANTTVQTWMKSFDSQHSLLIADACFAGDLFRSGPGSMRDFTRDTDYYQRVFDLPSRKALTSGGVEPVLDGGAEGHSVFTYYLLKALRENPLPYMDAQELFDAVYTPVFNNSAQTPLFQPIRDSGDEGGLFVFVK